MSTTGVPSSPAVRASICVQHQDEEGDLGEGLRESICIKHRMGDDGTVKVHHAPLPAPHLGGVALPLHGVSHPVGDVQVAALVQGAGLTREQDVGKRAQMSVLQRNPPDHRRVCEIRNQTIQCYFNFPFSLK